MDNLLQGKPLYKMQKQYRLPGWNYASEGGYFVTICTKDRKEIFGDVIDHEVKLSAIGDKKNAINPVVQNSCLYVYPFVTRLYFNLSNTPM